MGSEVGLKRGGGFAFPSLIRRKQLGSVHSRQSEGQHQLAKELTLLQLISIGVGSTIGAGVYVIVGTVAREHSGPALTVSFIIAGIAIGISALCYAELASRCPSAGSAYHYSYVCVGEGVAWLIGWSLILENTIGGSAVARGISPNLALLFGGENSLPFPLARTLIPGLNVVVDPCAAILVLVVTGLFCTGIKESSFVQAVVTTANLCVMAFVIVVGGYLGFQTGWAGYELPNGYFPFGVNGVLAGSATVFFAYIGFDSITTCAEEVKNPQRDLPLSIGVALSICCALYMLVSAVIVGLVPYYAMDPDTPISSAFASHGMQWSAHVITAGAIAALCSTIMGSMISQPRILMAMARDGLLPLFFSDVNEHTQVPVKSSLLSGICIAVLAFFMDVSQLAGMVSVGTLLAFTIVAISILILRYVPRDEVPLPSSFQESPNPVSLQYSSSEDIDRKTRKYLIGTSSEYHQHFQRKGEALPGYPLIEKDDQKKLNEQDKQRIASWSIAFVCIGVLLMASAASAEFLTSLLRYSICGLGGLLLLCSVTALWWIGQDGARNHFGHTGVFLCPFVPVLPAACIMINVYLMINLGAGTWIRVSVWMVVGVFIYLFYGRNHSLQQDTVYMPTAMADEICQSS